MCKRNQGRRRDPGDEEEKAEKESEDFDNVTAQRGGVLRIHERAQRGADRRRSRHGRKNREQQREGKVVRGQKKQQGERGEEAKQTEPKRESTPGEWQLHTPQLSEGAAQQSCSSANICAAAVLQCWT